MTLINENSIYYTWAGLTFRLLDPPSVIKKSMVKMFFLSTSPANDQAVDVRMVLQKDDAFVANMPGEVRTWYDDLPPDRMPVIRSDPERGFVVLTKGSATGSYSVCRPPYTECSIYSQVLTKKSSSLLFNVVLIPTIRELMLHRGRVLLHAGCVVSPRGDGFIIVADSGGGKTTTSICLVRQGFSFISDDLVALSIEDGRIRVEGIPKPVNLSRRTIGFFPELLYLASSFRQSGDGKMPVGPLDLFGPERVIGSAFASTILFTKLDADGPRIEALGAQEAFKALLKGHTFAHGGQVSQSSLDILWSLLERATPIRLITGHDPLLLGHWVARHVSQQELNEPAETKTADRLHAYPARTGQKGRSRLGKSGMVTELQPELFCKLVRLILDYTLDGEDDDRCEIMDSITGPLVTAAWKSMQHHRIEAHMVKWFSRISGASKGQIALVDPEKAIRRASAHALDLQLAAVTAIDRLSRSGIEVMMLRGPAFAIRYFPEPCMRHCRDVDIICRPEDLVKAEKVLLELGYSALGEKEYWTPRGEWPFSNGRHTIELHWDAYPVMRRPVLDDFWQEHETVDMGGRTVLCLGPNRLLLSSCMHAFWEHKLDRIVRLVDIRQIIKVAGNRLNWNWIVQQTLASGNALALGVTLRCAKELVGAAVPEQVLEELKPVKLNERLSNWTLSPSKLVCSRGVMANIRKFLLFRTLW